MSQQKIGLIGLGAMGLGMAGSLRRAGYEVHVCDIRKEVAEGFAKAGGVAHDTPAALAQHVEVIVGVVVNAEQTELLKMVDDSMKRLDLAVHLLVKKATRQL